MDPKNTKIGYFETWNSEAGMVEKSSSRLQSLFTLFFVFFMDFIYWSDGGSFSDWGFLMFNLIFLIAAYYPKYLKDLGEHIPKK